jgi:hypothetical protein
MRYVAVSVGVLTSFLLYAFAIGGGKSGSVLLHIRMLGDVNLRHDCVLQLSLDLPGFSAPS